MDEIVEELQGAGLRVDHHAEVMDEDVDCRLQITSV
jgi:hypothetical protein